MPVRVLLKSMTSKEITEWMAYYTWQNQKNAPESTKDVLSNMFAHKIVKGKS